MSKIRTRKPGRLKKCKISANIKFFIIILLTTLTVYRCSAIPFSNVAIRDLISSQIEPLSKAMLDAIRTFYIAKGIKFDFITYGETTGQIGNVVNRVTKELSGEVLVKQIRISNVSNWNHRFKKSAVIFVKSEKFLRFLQLASVYYGGNFLLANLLPEPLRFLVYVDEAMSLDELDAVVKKQSVELSGKPADLRHFELFVTHDRDFVRFSANLLYSQDHCGFFKLAKLNALDKKSQRWIGKLESIDYDTDFHGCLFSFSMILGSYFYTDPEYMILINRAYLPSEGVSFNGLLNEILTSMSIRKNFSLHYTLLAVDNSLYGTKNLKMPLNKSMILHPGYLSMHNRHFHFSAPLITVKCYYLLTLNDLYTNYEKLTMPFDATTWVLLTLTFAHTFVFILVLYRCPRLIRTAVFGSGVQNPGYNALGIFFGISQLRLPRESVSRFILLLFIWFCLIFRTCYQSMMFEFMTSDMRKPMPKSIEDLRSMDYTIVVIDDPAYHDLNDEIINGRERPAVLACNVAQFLSMYRQVLDGEIKAKSAFLVSNEIHMNFNATFRRSLPVMENELLVKTMSLEMGRNNFLFPELNRVLESFISAGIAEYLQDYGRWLVYRPIYDQPVDPRRVLSLSDLEYGFVLWAMACAVSLVVFICEIIALLWRKHIPDLIALVGFLQLLRMRMDRYNDNW